MAEKVVMQRTVLMIMMSQDACRQTWSQSWVAGINSSLAGHDMIGACDNASNALGTNATSLAFPMLAASQNALATSERRQVSSS